MIATAEPAYNCICFDRFLTVMVLQLKLFMFIPFEVFHKRAPLYSAWKIGFNPDFILPIFDFAAFLITTKRLYDNSSVGRLVRPSVRNGFSAVMGRLWSPDRPAFNPCRPISFLDL